MRPYFTRAEQAETERRKKKAFPLQQLQNCATLVLQTNGSASLIHLIMMIILSHFHNVMTSHHAHSSCSSTLSSTYIRIMRFKTTSSILELESKVVRHLEIAQLDPSC